MYAILVVLLSYSVVCESCFTYDFESRFDEFRNELRTCAGLGTWTSRYYSDMSLHSPHPNSETFITPASTAMSCVSSFPFPMTSQGYVEVNIYLDSAVASDQLTVLAFQGTGADADPTVGSFSFNAANPSFGDGWYTIRFSVSGATSYDGYLSFVGLASANSVLIIDSFRFIPSTANQEDSICDIYKEDEPTTTTEITSTTEPITEITSTTESIDTTSTTTETPPTEYSSTVTTPTTTEISTITEISSTTLLETSTSEASTTTDASTTELTPDTTTQTTTEITLGTTTSESSVITDILSTTDDSTTEISTNYDTMSTSTEIPTTTEVMSSTTTEEISTTYAITTSDATSTTSTTFFTTDSTYTTQQIIDSTTETSPVSSVQDITSTPTFNTNPPVTLPVIDTSSTFWNALTITMVVLISFILMCLIWFACYQLGKKKSKKDKRPIICMDQLEIPASIIMPRVTSRRVNSFSRPYNRMHV